MNCVSLASVSMLLGSMLVPFTGLADDSEVVKNPPQAVVPTPARHSKVAPAAEPRPGKKEEGGTGRGAVPFAEGMTRPQRLSGPAPKYTPEALARRAQGLVIARCIITTEGEVQDCALIKPLPFLGQAVLDSLHASRYQPATWQGQPISVQYVISLRLHPPR